MSTMTWRRSVDLILKLYYTGQLTRAVLDDFRDFLKGKETERWHSVDYVDLVIAADEFCYRQDDYTAMKLNIARWRAYEPRYNYDRPTERSCGYAPLY